MKAENVPGPIYMKHVSDYEDENDYEDDEDEDEDDDMEEVS